LTILSEICISAANLLFFFETKDNWLVF
jgi:hypothetical protein